MDIFEEEKKNGKYKHGYDEDIWKKFSLFLYACEFPIQIVKFSYFFPYLKIKLETCVEQKW